MRFVLRLKSFFKLAIWPLLILIIFLSDNVWHRPAHLVKGALHLPLAAFAQDLNTATAYNSVSYGLLHQIIKPITRFEMIQGQLQAKPCAVESFSKESLEDRDRYTFTIDNNHMFFAHPALENRATPVQVEDFLFQIARLASSRYACPIKAQLRQGLPFFSQLEKRLEEVDLEDIFFDDLEGLSYDDKTFRIESDKDFPLESWMTLPFFAPYPRQAERFIQQQDVYHGEHHFPISNGDFHIQTFLDDNLIHLKANQPLGGDYVSDVYFHADKEPLSTLHKFKSGHLDQISPDVNIVNQVFEDSSLKQFRTQWQKRNISLYTLSEPVMFYLGFNMKTRHFQPETFSLVRQHVAQSLDWEFLCDRIFDGLAVPSHTFLPQSLMPEAQQADLQIIASQEQIKPLENHYSLKMLFPKSQSSLSQRFKAWLIHSLKKHGIDLIIFELDFADIRQALEDNNHDIFFSGWGADFPDPKNFYMLLYSNNALLLSGGDNTSNFSNKTFDHLFENFTSKDIASLENIIARLHPVVPAYSPKSLILTQPWLTRDPPQAFIHQSWHEIQLDNQSRDMTISQENAVVKEPLMIFLSFVFLVVAYSRRKL